MSQYIHEDKIEELEIKTNEARELLIEMLTEAGSGHTAGPLGMADIFTAMYFHVLNHDPKNPMMEDRDRLILSNGHITPIRYVVMAMAEYFPVEELKSLGFIVLCPMVNKMRGQHGKRLCLPARISYTT